MVKFPFTFLTRYIIQLLEFVVVNLYYAVDLFKVLL